jgi:peptidoglycan-associated lipoprotein
MGLRRASLALALPFVLVGLVGCDSPGFSRRAKAPVSPGAPVGQATTTSAGVGPSGGGAHGNAVSTPGLSVSDRIAQACGIAPRNGAALTPSFEYDSAALGDADRAMLADVAKCLTEGALKGKAVTLVGRADARGEPEYNMTLGESRANTVHRYMVDLGVGKDRMRVTSRGEIDAEGKDEAGYAHDRRVDIDLAP